MFPFRDDNPSCRTHYVTYDLIGVNCLIFFGYWGDLNNYQMTLDIYEKWAPIPSRLGQSQGFETLITSAFLHGGFWHLGVALARGLRCRRFELHEILDPPGHRLGGGLGGKKTNKKQKTCLWKSRNPQKTNKRTLYKT